MQNPGRQFLYPLPHPVFTAHAPKFDSVFVRHIDIPVQQPAGGSQQRHLLADKLYLTPVATQSHHFGPKWGP